MNLRLLGTAAAAGLQYIGWSVGQSAPSGTGSCGWAMYMYWSLIAQWPAVL